MSKERRLGRGLEALLSRADEAQGFGHEHTADGDVGDYHPPVVAGGGGDGQRLVWLNVYEIERNPYQPRHDFDEEAIATLRESIQEHGMLQPLVVRRVGDRNQLISGERRLRAATAAGWEKVPVQFRDADDRQVAELAIVENVQRKDLNPLEKAASFQRYLQEYSCTQDELAARVKIDRSTIANLIRLLELPQAVQQALRDGAITQGHARALLPLGDEREQVDFCRRIVEESLSVRAVEQLVQDAIHAADGEPFGVVGGDQQPVRAKRKASRNDQVAYLEQELRTALGTKVEIRQSARGRGRVTIHFKNHEEFERLRQLLAEPSQPGAQSRAG